VSRRQSWLLAAAGVLAAAMIWIAAAGEGGRGSALSRGPEGWLAARRYLESRGAEVRLLDAPPAADRAAEPEGVLVEVFPWSAPVPAGRRASALARRLAAGGDLVIAYSGGYDPREDRVLEALGIGLVAVRDEPPLGPLAWRRDARLSWRLMPETGIEPGAADSAPAPEPGAAAGTAVVALPAPRWAPRAPAEAEVLYRSPDGTPLVFALERTSGGKRARLAVLPAAALANAGLAGAGNADLLEGLLAAFGRRWAFDESAHGLAAPGAGDPDAERAGRAFDLVLAHLALLYLLAVAALARRFGPAWREPPVATGSTAAFLLRLGALHHRLGHHRDAAARLVERWRELHPRHAVPAALARRAEEADADGLVAVARALARRDRRSAILPAGREAAPAPEPRR
jgi:hypothetical protein